MLFLINVVLAGPIALLERMRKFFHRPPRVTITVITPDDLSFEDHAALREAVNRWKTDGGR